MPPTDPAPALVAAFLRYSRLMAEEQVRLRSVETEGRDVEPLHVFGVLRELTRQDLDRYDTVQTQLPGLEHVRHRARADLLDNLVAGYLTRAARLIHRLLETIDLTLRNDAMLDEGPS